MSTVHEDPSEARCVPTITPSWIISSRALCSLVTFRYWCGGVPVTVLKCTWDAALLRCTSLASVSMSRRWSKSRFGDAFELHVAGEPNVLVVVSEATWPARRGPGRQTARRESWRPSQSALVAGSAVPHRYRPTPRRRGVHRGRREARSEHRAPYRCMAYVTSSLRGTRQPRRRTRTPRASPRCPSPGRRPHTAGPHRSRRGGRGRSASRTCRRLRPDDQPLEVT